MFLGIVCFLLQGFFWAGAAEKPIGFDEEKEKPPLPQSSGTRLAMSQNPSPDVIVLRFVGPRMKLFSHRVASGPAPSQSDVSLEIPVSHKVVVQFKSSTSQLYQVCWDVFGQLYKHEAIEAILETYLLREDEGAFVERDSKLGRVINDSRYGLRRFLEKNMSVSYDFSEGKHLTVEQFSQMFPEGKNQKWQVLSSGCIANLKPGEGRILFNGRGVSFVETDEEGCDGVLKDSARYKQIEQEQTPEFVGFVYRLARERIRTLEAHTDRDSDVVVRCVNDQGQERSILWNGALVLDASDSPLREFLRYCVMQGSSLGYTDESSVRYFPFVNGSLDALVEKHLWHDLQYGVGTVSFVAGEDHLRPEDLRPFNKMMGWTVVPRGSRCRPGRKGSCTISFADVTLEGVAIAFPLHTFHPRLFTRNYLWAFAFEALQEHEPVRDGFWYFSMEAIWVTPVRVSRLFGAIHE